MPIPLSQETREKIIYHKKAGAKNADIIKWLRVKVFAYGANVACDGHNYILDFELTPGNLHDSVVFPRLYERLIKNTPR